MGYVFNGVKTMEWVREGKIYVAQGKEADGGEDVELTIENVGYPKKPWQLRAAGGIVGHTKSLMEAKRLGEMYCERGLSNTGNDPR
jgi:hypothetical protein